MPRGLVDRETADSRVLPGFVAWRVKQMEAGWDSRKKGSRLLIVMRALPSKVQLVRVGEK